MLLVHPAINPEVQGSNLAVDILALLVSTGGWKPFRYPQKFIFDSILNMHYVIID